MSSLASTYFIDCDSPEVAAFVSRHVAPGATPETRAIALFYAVRDRILYDVYGSDLSRAGLRASAVLRARSGFCLHKSVVYVAAARHVGIPARLAFADVRNHLSSQRLRELVGGDVFRYHGYAELLLNGRWLKVTPVFNRALCQLFGVKELDFDGKTDCVFQPFDERGAQYLEVLVEHGSFEDFPYEQCLESLRTHHPRIFAKSTERTVSGDLLREARTEASNPEKLP
jgi:transglutaminase-like putative cysteine protease